MKCGKPVSFEVKSLLTPYVLLIKARFGQKLSFLIKMYDVNNTSDLSIQCELSSFLLVIFGKKHVNP